MSTHTPAALGNLAVVNSNSHVKPTIALGRARLRAPLPLLRMVHNKRLGTSAHFITPLVMINWASVIAVFSVYITGVVIPGPNFVAVAHKAASSTRREALAMVAGIVLVNVFWASCAMLGMGAALLAFPWVSWLVKLIGATYLIWFGAKLLFRRQYRQQTPSAGDRNGEGSLMGMPGGRRFAFMQGFKTNIVNPKSIALFAAIFASATPPHLSWPTFAAMLGVVGVIASGWYSFVAIMLSHRHVARAYQRYRIAIDRVCGSAIILLGVRQLVR